LSKIKKSSAVHCSIVLTSARLLVTCCSSVGRSMSSALPPALYLSHERREKRSRVIEEWCVKPSVGSTNVSITD
jgi:hypothetical protein